MGDNSKKNAPPVLDTRGLKCPLPVIKVEAQLRRMSHGDTLKVFADDPLAVVDIPHFCTQAGHSVMVDESDDSTCVFLVTATDKMDDPPI